MNSMAMTPRKAANMLACFAAGALANVYFGANYQLARCLDANVVPVWGSVYAECLSKGLTALAMGALRCKPIPNELWTSREACWNYVAALGVAASMVLSVVSVPVIGMLLGNLIMIVAMLAFSLLSDHVGFLALPQRPLTRAKAAGTVVATMGVVATMDGVFSQDYAASVTSAVVLAVVLGQVVGGALFTLDMAANQNLLGPAKGDDVQVAVVSAILACGALVVPSVVGLYAYGVAEGFSVEKAWYWLLICGVTGPSNAYEAVYFPEVIGLASTTLLLTAGGVVSALLFDSFGVFSEEVQVSAARLLGTAVAVAGVVAVQYVSAAEAKETVTQGVQCSDGAVPKCDASEQSQALIF